MAAYAALVSLINDLELIPNHPIHSFSFDNTQITSLTQTVDFLIEFMDSYDSHGCSREAAEVLERKITSAAHAAHDVIESHVVDQIHAGSTLGGKARFTYFLLDLQKAIDNMDFVKRKAMKFKAKSGLKAELPTYSPPTSSEPLKKVMVGFDDVALRLLDMLTGEPSSERVIPIVGMGGLGKTTLARNAYDHLLIQHHFDVRLWATISQKYSVETILKQLLSRTSGNANELGEELHKMLWGRRYLIVLDDMWSVEAWDEIHMFLPDNGNGSHVIVTSRLSNLAACLSPFPFVMDFLDEDKSWELFCGKVFGEEECPVGLEEIGKKIVNRCKGLPLSIVVIGGHLRRSSRAIEYWEKVSTSMNLISSLGVDDQCLEIISLSYEHLPACLKPCLLFMGIYGEDEVRDASGLVKSWVGEGFVKAKKGVSLEEVAEDYLNDLIDRNLMLVHFRKWNGKAVGCSIHDIVRELCIKVGKKEKFMFMVEDTTQAIGIQRERRVVIPEGKEVNSDIISSVESAPLLRSLMNFKGKSGELSVKSRILRVLVDVNSNFKEDNTNFTRVNLRYLACYISSASSNYLIPSSISLIWNMQTLIIPNSDLQISAPYEIWDMPQLRHLQFSGGCFLPDPVSSERSKQQDCIVLENLHTLLGVENLRLTEEVCKRMPNLKDLSLIYYGDCNSYYYCPHNLGHFSKLESFCCAIFDRNSKWRDVVLSFTFPTSLKELILVNCHLSWEELTVMVESLPHLGFLQLDKVQGQEWDLVDEEFPCLKELRLSKCDDLVYWNANSSNFPVLEQLWITKVPKLNEIPFDIGEISTFRFIMLSNCSVSAAISAVRIVVEQESLENQDLQLQLDFGEMEEVERFKKTMVEDGLRIKNLIVCCQNEKIKVF